MITDMFNRLVSSAVPGSHSLFHGLINLSLGHVTRNASASVSLNRILTRERASVLTAASRSSSKSTRRSGRGCNKWEPMHRLGALEAHSHHYEVGTPMLPARSSTSTVF